MTKPIEQQWQDCCRGIASLLVPPEEDMVPDPLNTQKRQANLVEICSSLSNSELAQLLFGGIQQLVESNRAEDKELFSQLSQHMNTFELNMTESEIQDLAIELHIEGHLLNKLEQHAIELGTHGKYHEAAGFFSVLVFLKPQDDKAWFQLAFSLYQEANFALALNAVQVAQALQPYQPEYWVLGASCYEVLKDQGQLLQTLEHIKQLINEHHLVLSPDWQGFYDSLVLNKHS